MSKIGTNRLKAIAAAIAITGLLATATPHADGKTVLIEGVLGASTTSFDHPPVLNASGEVAYYRFKSICIGLPGNPCANEWIRRGDGQSSPVTIAAEDDPVVGLGTILLDLTPDDTSFEDLGPRITDSGAVMFHASLSGPFINATNDSGIFSGNGGALGEVAREGTPSPTGANYSGFEAMAINNIGEQAFIADLAGAGSPEGVFRRQGGAVTVVQTGNAAPSGGTFALFGNDSATNTRGIAINNNATHSLNQVAFYALLNGTPVPTDTGLYRSRRTLVPPVPGEIPVTLVERENSIVAGGVTLMGQPVINENANTAFYASLNGSPASGIFLADNNSPAAAVATLAQAGGTAPGTTRVFDGFGRRPALNDLDWVGFKATTSPSTGSGQSEGIYRASLGGAGALVAQVFNTTWVHGATDRFFTGVFDDNVAINNRNIMAFSGQTNNKVILGDDVQQGIYISFGSGKPALEVVRTGQILDGQTVASFQANLEPNQGGNTGLNDASQVAYQVTFASGGTGIYLYTPPLKAFFTTATSYGWTDPSDWQLNFVPPTDTALFLPTPAIYDVFVGDQASKLPASPATMTSPNAPTTVASLTIGQEGVGPGPSLNITLQVDHLAAETDPTLTVNGPLNIFPIASLKISDPGAAAPLAVAAMDTLTNHGQIELATGGHLGGPAPLHNHGTVKGQGTIDNRLLNMPSGEVVVGDGKALHFTHAGATHESAGTIGISIGAALTFDDDLLTAAGSNTAIELGTLNVPGDGLPNGTGLTHHGSMTLLEATINGDVHTAAGASIEITGSATFNGMYSGVGNITGAGVANFNGGVSPGLSPGVIEIATHVVLGPANVTRIEVQSPDPPTDAPEPGIDHDQLAISGPVSLDGTLAIHMNKPDLRPAYGARYEVMTYATRIVSATPTMFTDIQDALIDTSFALAPLFTDGLLTLRASIPGDLNFDDTVSVADLAEFALHFDTMPGFYDESALKNSWQLGDFNTDGQITVADLSLLALNFGFDAAAGLPAAGLSLDEIAALAGIDLTNTPTPEPGTLGILASLGILLPRRRPSQPKHDSPR